MIKAALASREQPGCGMVTVSFPIPREDYDRTIELLESLSIGDPVDQDCLVNALDSSYSVLKRLEYTSVNVDELDYLAKRLDSFFGGEGAQFQAMAHKLDGQAIALDLIQSGKGTVTPYGVIFDNSMELEPVYDGQHFPLYFYEMPLLNLEVRNEQPDSPVEYLGLPASDKQIEQTLLRAGVTDQSAALWDVESGELSEPVALAIDLMREDISSLNGLCRAIEPLDIAQREKLDAVVLLARPKCASEVRQLAENLDQFNFVPKPFNPEADCAITDLGYVAYHGSLALDELMQEDPAEPEIGPMLM